jgi:predicted DsbA family dithiol-disulfide isomerase
MDASDIRFFFDYVDPLSYLEELELGSLEEDGLPSIARVPFEIRPPPREMLDPDGEEWRSLWRRATSAAGDVGVRLTEPPLLPWTRKAHELALHAGERGLGPEAHRAIFDAVFTRGADVGRVDVLVGIAEALGMDRMETKVVLDVDRHAARVEALRDAASAAGVVGTPTLSRPGRTLQGFHNRDTVRTFLRSP